MEVKEKTARLMRIKESGPPSPRLLHRHREIIMSITTRLIDAVPLPMIYVRTRTAMRGDAISSEVGKAFELLGRFMAEEHVKAVAPPLAVYSEWNGRLVTIDVGFPVAESELAKAKGDIHAGKTPSGPAMKAIHHGPFESMKDTYAALERAIEDHGGHVGDVSWEIYFNDPATTAPKDLVTEVYMRLTDVAAASATRQA